MRREIDGLLVPEWTLRESVLGLKVRSPSPTNYTIDEGEGDSPTILDLLAPFQRAGVDFVKITIQEIDVEGNDV